MTKTEKSDDMVINARPTKEFFIHMLTKDIKLIRAIIDLVDNSWDGALRVSEKHPLQQLSIELDISEDAFVITDNCGGIPHKIAKEYAFRFGRPEGMEKTDRSVGQFGVGMKRSLFKIGTRFAVESVSPDAKFKVAVDVSEWVDAPEWEFRFDTLDHLQRSPPWSNCGTKITVTGLHDSVSIDFGTELFVSELRDAIQSAHEQSLGKGIIIKINQVPIVVHHATLKQSGSLKPGHAKIRFAEDSDTPVDVNIYTGVSDSSPQEAGWNVYCNGRMVLESDRSIITGWGTGHGKQIPHYHNQFARFRGYVFFECDDATKLPWNTTKTGVDENSPVYEAIRQRMVQMMRPVIDFLNRVDGEKEVVENEQVLTKAVDRAKPVQHSLIAQESPFKTPPVKATQDAADSMKTISYKVSTDAFEDVKAALEATSNKEVGERTFQYFYDLEC